MRRLLARGLLRSSVLRVLLCLLAVMVLLLSGVEATLAAISLGGEQQATKRMGSAEHLMGGDPAGPGQPVPDRVAAAVRASGATEVATVLGAAGLRMSQWPDSTFYVEEPFAGALSSPKYRLVAGRWPTRPGEVAVAPSLVGMAPIGRELAPAVGTWPVRVVGIVESAWGETDPTVYGAPGTWSKWRLSADQRATVQLSADTEVLWNGGDDAHILSAVTAGQVGEVPAITERAALAATTRADQRVPTLFVLPAVGLCTVVALAVGAARRWSAGDADGVRASGVGDQVIGWTAFTTSITLVVVTLAATPLLAGLTVLALRPALARLLSPQPLGPAGPLWPPLIGWLLVTAVVAVLAGWRAGATRRQIVGAPGSSHRGRRWLTRGGWFAGVTGGVCVVAVVLLRATIWGLLVASIAGVLVPLVATTALLRGVAGRRFGRPQWTWSSRLLDEGLGRISVGVTALGMVLSVVLGSVVSISTAVERQNELNNASMPVGTATISPARGAERAASKARERLLSELGEMDAPVPAAFGPYWTPDHAGTGIVVSDIAALERVVGTLSVQARRCVETGGTVAPGSGSAALVVNDDERSVAEMAVCSDQGGPAYARTVPFVTTRGALAAHRLAAPTLSAWILTNLDGRQEAVLRDWRRNSPDRSIIVETSAAGPRAPVPGWVVLVAAGIGCGLALALAAVVGPEVRRVADLAAPLRATGLSRRWVMSVAAGIHGSMVVVLVVTGLGSVLATAALLGLAQSAVRLPWPILGGIATGLLMGAVVGIGAVGWRITRPPRW